MNTPAFRRTPRAGPADQALRCRPPAGNRQALASDDDEGERESAAFLPDDAASAAATPRIAASPATLMIAPLSVVARRASGMVNADKVSEYCSPAATSRSKAMPTPPATPTTPRIRIHNAGVVERRGTPAYVRPVASSPRPPPTSSPARRQAVLLYGSPSVALVRPSAPTPGPAHHAGECALTTNGASPVATTRLDAATTANSDVVPRTAPVLAATNCACAYCGTVLDSPVHSSRICASVDAAEVLGHAGVPAGAVFQLPGLLHMLGCLARGGLTHRSRIALRCGGAFSAAGTRSVHVALVATAPITPDNPQQLPSIVARVPPEEITPALERRLAPRMTLHSDGSVSFWSRADGLVYDMLWCSACLPLLVLAGVAVRASAAPGSAHAPAVGTHLLFHRCRLGPL